MFLPHKFLFPLTFHNSKKKKKKLGHFIKHLAIDKLQMLLNSKFKHKLRKLSFSLTQTSTFVNVKTKSNPKPDPLFNSTPIFSHPKPLKTLLTLKTLITHQPQFSPLPISALSKRSRSLEIPGRVASFLRRYPSFFHETPGPHNHPYFSLTPFALQLHHHELQLYQNRKLEIAHRLRKLLLMANDRMLPFRVVQGMLWYLGLPEDFLRNPDGDFEKVGNFEVIEVGDGEKWLRAVVDPNECDRVLSAIESGGGNGFPLFPSKGVRLKRKVLDWMERFQGIPYVSPYEDRSGLERGSDVFEKRVVGVLHELLSLFVDCAAERRRLLCLRKHLGLPQKFDKCFERHPHVFYKMLRDKTCYVVLKEAYCGGERSGIEEHPMLEVRKKYVELMNKSEDILRMRRTGKRLKEDEEDVNEYKDKAVEEGIKEF